jgi:hypothetical protein
LDVGTQNASEVLYGDDFNDFIYRGNRFGGTINAIDGQDELLGMKPGGLAERMLRDRGDRGATKQIVIQNLTINESGNPQKTLRMIKQAIRAHSGDD